MDRLEDFDLSVLAFLWDGRVPFTNNQGEQDIRMIKVRQKISGCFRTLRGAQMFCRIRSYLSTCRKQGRNLWEAIEMAVVAGPSSPHALRRLPEFGTVFVALSGCAMIVDLAEHLVVDHGRRRGSANKADRDNTALTE